MRIFRTTNEPAPGIEISPRIAGFAMLAIGFLFAVFSFTDSATFAQTTFAQTANDARADSESDIPTSGKGGPEVVSMIEPVAVKLAARVVEFVDSGERIALGTVISADGIVATKSSELPQQGHIACLDANATALPFVVLERIESSDLAIVKIDIFNSNVAPAFADLPPVSFPQATNSPEAGRFVISVCSEDVHSMLGTVSIETAPYKTFSPVSIDSVDLGMSCQSVGVRADIYRNHVAQAPAQSSDGAVEAYPSALLVTRVYPQSVAESAGVLMHDVIFKINGETFGDTPRLDEFVESLVPGERIRAVVLRGDQVVTLESRVPRTSRPIFHDRWGGGPFSRRRFGFSDVITHDTPLPVDQCGGPLLDLEGNVVGVNIARSLRVSTLALPIGYVLTIADQVRTGTAGIEQPGVGQLSVGQSGIGQPGSDQPIMPATGSGD